MNYIGFYLITVKKITTIFQKTLTRSYDEKEKFGPRSKTKKNIAQIHNNFQVIPFSWYLPT